MRLTLPSHRAVNFTGDSGEVGLSLPFRSQYAFFSAPANESQNLAAAPPPQHWLDKRFPGDFRSIMLSARTIAFSTVRLDLGSLLARRCKHCKIQLITVSRCKGVA